jgi:hypothetical protein
VRIHEDIDDAGSVLKDGAHDPLELHGDKFWEDSFFGQSGPQSLGQLGLSYGARSLTLALGLVAVPSCELSNALLAQPWPILAI